MTHNIFQELQDKKQTLINIANKAVEFGWIPQNKSHDNEKFKDLISLEDIKEKLDKDTLTIGVIGQMKCGKSTFLNSFVFKNDVLPAATEPMTSALSVITYGEKERIVAEFYTKDEWEEQKLQANRNIDEAYDNLDASKIQAAKELVTKASKLGSLLDTFLGETKEDTLENLIDYVSANGKYVSITKSVTIYYPQEYLKGVEIVDTPGFNDPIVSREEKTKVFLRKADVVIMMLYAGRPFDATDRDIIFKNVRECGIGKVIIGINKYDIPYCSNIPEDENQIKDYVKTEIQKACRECNDKTIAEIINEVEPIPLSAEMALLSQLPMSKIASTESFNYAYKRHCSNFGISTQNEMYQWSHISEFIAAVKNVIENEKYKILFAKPLNAILAAGNKIQSDNEINLSLIKNKIETLMLPDIDLDEKEDNINKLHKRLSKKIISLDEDINYEIKNIVNRGKKDLENAVDDACEQMLNIVHNEWNYFKSDDYVNSRLETIKQKLTTRTLKRLTDNLSQDGNHKIKNYLSDFFTDIEDLLMRYLPDFESRDFIKSISNHINMELEESSLFSNKSDDIHNNNNIAFALLTVVFAGPIMIGTITNRLLFHHNIEAKVANRINKISGDFDPMPYLNLAFKTKNDIIAFIKEKLISELIEPLQKQILEIKSSKDNKEIELQNSKIRKDELENIKLIISKQTYEIITLKNSII